MGEIDLIKDHYEPGFVTGVVYVFLTVILAWLPLALAGIVLVWRRAVHATMRGAAPLRLLARVAIAVQVGAVAFPLLFLVGTLDYIWNPRVLWQEVFFTVAIFAGILIPIAAISAAGIIAWHRVLAALASREGDGRLLV